MNALQNFCCSSLATAGAGTTEPVFGHGEKADMVCVIRASVCLSPPLVLAW